MIYFILEQVIRSAQMPFDCLRASKLVTLGCVYNTNQLVIQLVLLVFNSE